MAIKYRLKFNNFDLKDVIVTLESDKYTGAVTDIIGVGGESYSKNVNWGDHPHETHVGTTNASVKVYTDAIDVDSLQMSSDKDWKMRVTVDGVLDFTGFLIPDGIQNTKKGAGNVVQLNATCGLALLSGLKFVPNDTIGLVTHDGQVASKYAPIMFFRAILNQLGNTLPIKWSTSIRCDEFPTRDSVAGALEWGTNLNLTTMLEFDNIDSMWMFHELAKSLKLWVCQDGDSWSFINKEDEVRLDGVLPVSRIDDGLGSVTSTTTPVDFKQNLNGSQLFDDAYTYYKPAIGKSRVYYNHVQDENILPNGGFDYVDNNKPVGWSFKNGTTAQLKSYPSIIERAGRAASLEIISVQGQPPVEDIFSLDYPMNVDANVLFKDMRFGFTVLPMDGFATDNEGYISWGQFPLKMSMKYSIIREGVLSDYYLNEFGYWSDKNIPPNQEIVDSYITPVGNSYSLWIKFNPTKSFFVGDRFNITFLRDGQREFYTHVFTETIDVEGGIDILKSIIPNSHNTTDPVATLYIGSVNNSSNFSVIMDKADNYYKYIYPSLDKMKPVTDVGKWEFQTKGNSGFIKMPDPLELYNKDTQAGKLTLEFFVRSGQRYILDDVWMTFNGNQDIYELTTNKDNSFEKFDMGVSSSFSGFMLSSYMNNYGNANKMMNFTDYSAASKRLTELYGRGIMNWRYTPRMMYQGSFKVNSFSPFALVSVGGKKYIPLTYDYNVNKGQLVGAKLFEARIESPTIEVGHNNFKDKDGANYGNSSGGEGTLDLEQDLQAVTDIGAITNRVITVGGIRTGDLLGVPTHSPDVQLIVNGEAYAWVGDGATAGTPSGGGTLGELSDVVLTGLQNGQTITWDSALQMWKNSDGAGGGRWGEITGNITSQSDLVNYVNGQGFIRGETDTLQSVTDRGSTTTNPITINSGTAFGISFQRSSSDIGQIDFSSNNLNISAINHLLLQPNTGYVGINKTNPTVELDVNGRGLFSGTIRTSHTTPSDNNADLSNLSNTGYGLYSRGGGGNPALYMFRVDDYQGVPKVLISGNGDFNVEQTIYTGSNGNSIQWNQAYANSQSTGNPHQTSLQQVLDVGRIGDSINITNSLRIPSIPSNQGNSIWIGTGSTGTIDPTSFTISGASDANVGSRTNGQLLSWSSSQNKWINVNAPNSAVWGEITGNITSQVDLIGRLDAKANKDGSNATGTWPINVTGDAQTWNGLGLYRSIPQDGNMRSVLGVESTNGLAYEMTPVALRNFIGSPANGETLQSVLNRGSTATGNAILKSPPSGGDNALALYSTYTGGGFLLQGYYSDEVTPKNLLTQIAGGNVGIGTTDATDKLTVNGSIKSDAHYTGNIFASRIHLYTNYEKWIDFGSSSSRRFLLGTDGGTTGDDFLKIYSYKNEGTYSGTPFSINRLTNDVIMQGQLSVLGGNSTQWNQAYTHSQSTGNPHQTTWAQLLDKPVIDVNPTPNTVVQRDGDGYINAVYFKDSNNYISQSGMSYIYGGYGDGFHEKYSKQAVNQFLGMPANGDTLQSVTDRAWVSTNPIRVNQLQLTYSDGLTYNGIRQSNGIETEYWNEISSSGIKHRFTGFGNITLMTIGSNGDVSATGVISAPQAQITQSLRIPTVRPASPQNGDIWIQ